MICILAISETYGIEDYVKLARKFDEYDFYHARIKLVKKVFPLAEEGNAIIVRNDSCDCQCRLFFSNVHVSCRSTFFFIVNVLAQS